jgi:hypothetical protein
VAGQTDAIDADVRAGLPPQLLMERYDWQLWVAHPRLCHAFEQAAGIGFPPFRGYDPNPPATPHTTPVALADGNRGVLFPAGTAARLTGRFVHPQNRFADVRVRVSPTDGGGERDESFVVGMNAPNRLIVPLNGRPARVEVMTRFTDGEYRVMAAEVIGQD